MKFFRGSVLGIAIFCAAIPLVRAADAPGEDLFQQALVKESGERNLEGAIALYKEVIAQPGVHKLLSFEARIRMGTCYERLGEVQQAEEVYERIVKDSTAPQSEIAQEAAVGLKRLQIQMNETRQEKAGAIAPEPIVFIRKFQETGASLSVGPAFLLSEARPMTRLSVALRYRLTGVHRPLACYLEASALPPIGNSTPATAAKPFTSLITDYGTVSLQYQAALAIIAELPHGTQRTVIPEVGAGLTVTDSRETFVSAASSGEFSKRTVSPSLNLGIHFFPDHVFSFLLQGTHVSLPYPDSVQIPAPSHAQAFDFPRTLWSLEFKLQMKIGWLKRVPRPKP